MGLQISICAVSTYVQADLTYNGRVSHCICNVISKDSSVSQEILEHLQVKNSVLCLDILSLDQLPMLAQFAKVEGYVE